MPKLSLFRRFWGPPGSLRKEITIVITIKLAAIFVLWYCFFSPQHKTTVTPTVLEEQILNAREP